jgi:hypothetical protein
MRPYKSLSLGPTERKKKPDTVSSAKSLQSIKTYTISKEKKLNYLYKFFNKKALKLEKSKKYDFELITLPINYYLWKGIGKGLKYDASINTDGFFASKETASYYYGTNPDIRGTDLQFKIIKELKLIDIGSLYNMRKIWDIIDSISLKNINDKKSKIYNYIKSNYLVDNKKIGINSDIKDSKILPDIAHLYKTLLVETCVNYARSPNTKIKLPTKCIRKSDEVYDKKLIDFIKSIDDNIDGWIHFTTEDFHDEILIFDVNKHLKFIDYHLI